MACGRPMVRYVMLFHPRTVLSDGSMVTCKS
jgi:hypothetical protein